MKKTILEHLTVTGYAEGIDLTDSEVLAKNLKDAKVKVQEAKKSAKKAKQELNQALKDSLKKIKKEKDSEKKISNYGKRFTDFKSELTKETDALKTNYLSMVGKIERKESDMKMKLNQYKEKGKGKWKSFKHELNNDLDGIEKTLKDFMDYNKKKIKKLAS